MTDDKYLTLVTEYRKAVLKGNARQTERLHSALMDYYHKKKRAGKLRDFLNFLNHNDTYVQLWSATFLLTIEEEIAKSVLEDLSVNIPNDPQCPTGYASAILDLWPKGKMNL